ncbi:MAG: hypothetical protein Kow00120_09310 [Anaerolineae bacterium]
METREPKKGRGVPKETPAQNSIADLARALAAYCPAPDGARVPDALARRGFFAAGMVEQIRIMAETAVELVDSCGGAAAVIDALAASPAEKVRGVAAFAVPIVYAGDLDAQLKGLRFTGALDGTWPRELSVTTLHNLIIAHGVEAVLPRVRGWIADPDPAVRRLVVEAFRPRGVMLAHIDELKRDPAPLKALLEPLLDDESDYVRKAVANNLNDIAKTNPDTVLAWAGAWLTPDASEARRWIINRGLRTLVNDGHPAALKLLGYAPAAMLRVTWLEGTPQRVAINQLLPFAFDVHNPSRADVPVILVLLMDEPGKGDARRRRRYRLWQGVVKAGETRSVQKRIHFVDMTRQLREPGTYRLTVTVNGETLASREMLFAR